MQPRLDERLSLVQLEDGDGPNDRARVGPTHGLPGHVTRTRDVACAWVTPHRRDLCQSGCGVSVPGGGGRRRRAEHLRSSGSTCFVAVV